MNYNRQQRRALEADNRKQPDPLREVPKDEWPLNRPDRLHRVFRSRRFLVQEFLEHGGIIRLSVCRTSLEGGGDWKADIAWDDLQRLKREAGYADRYAVEIFPADDDLVNVANMRHLWLLTEAPAFAWQPE